MPGLPAVRGRLPSVLPCSLCAELTTSWGFFSFLFLLRCHVVLTSMHVIQHSAWDKHEEGQ